jgi:hypothetical protein
MENIPAESDATNQIKVIGRVYVVDANTSINSNTVHVLFQYQELGVSTSSTAICAVK